MPEKPRRALRTAVLTLQALVALVACTKREPAARDAGAAVPATASVASAVADAASPVASLPVDAATAPDASPDPACRTFASLCDGARFLVRALEGDATAWAYVDVASRHQCPFGSMPDDALLHCYTDAGWPNEGDCSAHGNRSLPDHFIRCEWPYHGGDVRADMRAALAAWKACLPDFAAPPIPSDWSVAPPTKAPANSPYRIPDAIVPTMSKRLPGDAGASIEHVNLCWTLANTEALLYTADLWGSNPLSWSYSLQLFLRPDAPGDAAP